MTKWAARERRRKLHGDEQFLQAGLCGLVALSPPPPPPHISLQSPTHFCCHLSKPVCKFTFMQQLWCGIASCSLYYNVGVVIKSVLFLVLLHKNTERHPERSKSGNEDEVCLILRNQITKTNKTWTQECAIVWSRAQSLVLFNLEKKNCPKWKINNYSFQHTMENLASHETWDLMDYGL